MSHGTDETTEEGRQLHAGQQSHNEFVCGDCGLSTQVLWNFLQHKIPHNICNGMFTCFLCQSFLESEVDLRNHYLHYHHIQPFAQETLRRHMPAPECSSLQLPNEPLQISDEDDSPCISDDGQGSIERQDKRNEDLQTSKEFQECNEQNSNEQLAHHNQPSLLNNSSQSYTDAGSYQEVQEVSGLGKELQMNCETRTEESENGANSILAQEHLPAYQIDTLDRETSYEVTAGWACSEDDLHRESISSNALSQIKKFASAVLTRNVAKEGKRKIIILCSSGSNKEYNFEDLVEQETTEEKRNMIIQQREGISAAEPLLHSRISSHVDVTKYERDFLFQIGMKESTGKNIRYMREVYICLYCENFEKHCLDRIIIHMTNCHESEIMDRCSPGQVRHAMVRPVTGITGAEVTSFQEYRAMLLNQKAMEERRKSRLRKDKGIPKHLISLPYLYCSKRFTTPTCTKLQHHTAKHLNLKRFLCEECGRSFRSWQLLQSHKKDHMNASYGKIKCSLCSFQSGNTQALNQHYRIHPKQAHLCHICGNMYSSLRKHVKVHSLDRPYPCPFQGCTFRFTSEVPCKIHYQAHTAQGQRFGCSKCNSRFSRKYHLLRHQVKIHGDFIEPPEVNSVSHHLNTDVKNFVSVEHDGQSTSKTGVENISMDEHDDHIVEDL